MANGKTKVGKVMDEFKAGTLTSGSKTGPKVTNPKQALAIGLSEARKAGTDVGKPPRVAAAQRGAVRKGRGLERAARMKRLSKAVL